jgi:tetratricopeptide (TPR) repeat protein
MKTVIAPILLLAAAFGLSACSSQKGAVARPAEVVQPPPVVVQKRPPPVSPLHRKALSLLEKKSYRQAIELMIGRYRDGLEREYVLAINGQLEVGDDAFSLGDYLSAAHAFKGVLTAYPAEPSLRARISHDPKRIRILMETCTSRMMEQGLDEYRRGRLESAIGKWKGVLAINPGQHEAKKSINTATVQLQALQNLKNR